MSTSNSDNDTSPSTSTTSITIPPNLSTLPSDILLLILSYLSAADLSNLHEALPPNCDARHIVAHPYLWRTLYAKDFPPLASALPHLRVTAHGRVDWRAAYRSADRRRIVVQNAGRNGWGFRRRIQPSQQNSQNQTGVAAGGIRVIVEGNIRRIVSDVQGPSTVVENGTARFNWSARSSRDDEQHDSNDQQ